MREIKFRAWKYNAKKMYPVTNMLWKEDWIGVNSTDSIGINYTDNHRPNEYELMQFTGLKDKSGVEIYEGDIVEICFHDFPNKVSYEIGTINWNEKSSAFKWFAKDPDPSDDNNYWLTHADIEGREVIGNIYENPELIESTPKKEEIK